MMDAHTNTLTASTVDVRGVQFPAITGSVLNLTVILDSQSMLPYIIRAYENHHIYGNSCNDLVVYTHTSVGGVQLPRRLNSCTMRKTCCLMPSSAMCRPILLFLRDSLTAFRPRRSAIPSCRYLRPRPCSRRSMEMQKCLNSGRYSLLDAVRQDARLTSLNSQNFLCYGGYPGKFSNVTVTQPLPGVPNFIISCSTMLPQMCN